MNMYANVEFKLQLKFCVNLEDEIFLVFRDGGGEGKVATHSFISDPNQQKISC
jgi:hypothetical protein